MFQVVAGRLGRANTKHTLLCSIIDASSLSCSWNTRKVSSGSHIIEAIAADAADYSAEIFVTVTTGSTSTSTTGRGKK